MGSKEIGAQCLDWLLSQAKTLNFNIEYILTNNRTLSDNHSPTVQTIATGAGLKIVPSLSEFLKAKDTDFIISVQYHEILKREHIRKAKEIAVNFHMAPLPEYRGCNQFSFSIANGDTEFGTTVHQLEEGIDSGAIIQERRFSIPGNIFVSELYERTFKETLILFKDSIPRILSGDFEKTPQSEYEGLRSVSTHYRKDIELLKKIDLSWNREKIERHIRATFMPGFPPPYCEIEGQRFFFSNHRQNENSIR